MVSGYFYSRDPDNAPLAPLLAATPNHFRYRGPRAPEGSSPRRRMFAHWVRHLYAGGMLKPRPAPRDDDHGLQCDRQADRRDERRRSKGFGLGVGQLTMPKIGTLWFYEGETLGYRALYGYFPKEDVS